MIHTWYDAVYAALLITIVCGGLALILVDEARQRRRVK